MGAVSALEPLSIGRVLWANSLVLMLVSVIALFSILLPDSYFSLANAQMISSTNAVLALLALAAVIPLVSGQFDMSIGFTLALSQSICAGLIIHSGVPPLIAGAVVLLIGMVIGLVNGLLVARAGLNAFITTLATGIVVQGFAQLYTGGASVFGRMPPLFLAWGRDRLLGVPLPLIYVLVVSTAMWAILRYTDWGRRCYAIGGNAKAARLIGIPVERMTVQVFVASGALAALAGILSTSILGSANPNIGLNYLLPAFAAVFLGAAPAGPGRFNAWGTVVAVYALAAGIGGLQQLGAAFYVEQFFNGGALLLAVALARWMAVRAAATR
jgi:ribose transport system permease protein